jgi:hypothetical protein
MINRIKGNRIVAAALIFVFGLSVCGCGGKDGQAGDTVSMYDLRTAMEAADTSLPEMTVLSKNDENAESLFTDNISDMDYDKIDDFFVSYATEGKNADEIVVIAVKDKNDVNTAKQTLEDHRESRRKLFEQYEPEQVKRIEDGIIFTEKQYAVLIICDNRDGVRKAFEETL